MLKPHWNLLKITMVDQINHLAYEILEESQTANSREVDAILLHHCLIISSGWERRMVVHKARKIWCHRNVNNNHQKVIKPFVMIWGLVWRVAMKSGSPYLEGILHSELLRKWKQQARPGMKSACLLRTRRDEGDLLVPIAKLEWRELINNACAHIIWVNIAVKEQEKDHLIIYVSCCYGQGVLIGPIYLPDSLLYLITGDWSLLNEPLVAPHLPGMYSLLKTLDLDLLFCI